MEHCVISILRTDTCLQAVKVDSRTVLVNDYVTVCQVRQHDSGFVEHFHRLAFVLAHQHNDRRHDAEQSHQNRHDECDYEEGFLPHPCHVFTGYDYPYIPEFHSYSSVTSLMNMSFILGTSSLKELIVTPLARRSERTEEVSEPSPMERTAV